MILGLLTLLTALSISGIAAYYSIIGLTAIFAAAYWPIVIMGVVLEFGKVMTTLWLHYNWERAPWKIKSYLVAAVAILMFITSMGIFGFLSKSHLDQAVPSGDIQAQVALFDEKIKTQRDNIDADRKALTQMDAAVDQIMGRTTDENGATKAANLRRSQAKERTRLQSEIDVAQKQIAVIQEQRAPVASQFRKAEADVGPIRYIAAVLYGDKADQNVLEAAVRWVIIIIVGVFDPLAIVLILAATTSIDWSKMDKLRRKKEEIEELKEEAKLEAELEEVVHPHQTVVVDLHEQETIPLDYKSPEEVEQLIAEMKTTTQRDWELAHEQIVTEILDLLNKEKETSHYNLDARDKAEALTIELAKKLESTENELVAAKESFNSTALKKEELQTQLDILSISYEDLEKQKKELEDSFGQAFNFELDKFNDLNTQFTILRHQHDELQQIADKQAFNIEMLNGQLDILRTTPPILEVPPVVEETPELMPLPELEVEIADLQLPPVNEEVEEELIMVDLPQVEVIEPVPFPEPTLMSTTMPPLPERHVIEAPSIPVDISLNLPAGGNASFGTGFPQTPAKGDLFLRVDFMPSKLFKWVGSRWIEIDKASTDTFAFNEQYIKLLVEKVASGEYDIDDLSVTEQEQIATYLKDNNG